VPLLCHVSYADQLKLAHFLEMLQRLPCGLVAGKSLMLVGIVVRNVFRLANGSVSVSSKVHSEMENLALRQQLLALPAQRPRPRLGSLDRLFWVALRRLWSGWRKPLVVVTPETVVHSHRTGFRWYWAWRSRAPRRAGRRAVSQKADHRSRIGSGHKHRLQSVYFPDVMVAQNTPHSHHHDSHPKVQVLGFTVISAGTEFPASQADRFRV